MPPAVPLIAAVAGYAATSAIGTGLFATLAGFVVSSAVNQLGSRALAKKPKQQAFTQEAQGRALLIRSSVETHKLIYGQAKVSSTLVYAETTNEGANPAGAPRTNKMLHLVVPLAGHEVEEITTLYLGEIPLTLDGNGFATSAPYQKTLTSTSTSTASALVSTAVRAANVSTITTLTAHGFAAGEEINVTGTSEASFRGVYTIASITSPTSFTYSNPGTDGSSPEGGQVTVTRV